MALASLVHKLPRAEGSDAASAQFASTCRTGRKPQSPELKYRLTQAKKELKGEIAKLPAAEKKKATAKAEKKKIEKAKKEEKKAEKKVEKDKKKAKKGGKELGENSASSVVDSDLHMKNRLMMEFHKLIDASGGQESLEERARMWQSLRDDEARKELKLREQFNVEDLA